MRIIDNGKKILINYEIDIIGITITSIIYFILDIYYFNFIIDDSFISFRYSEHLATGMGLDWNYRTDIFSYLLNIELICVISA